MEKGIIAIFISLFGLIRCESQKNIPCPLIWREVNTGDEFSEVTIPAALFGVNNYIGKSLTNNEDYLVGNIQDRVLYTARMDQIYENTTYFILENTHGCKLDWTNNINDEFLVPLPGRSSISIGRGAFDGTLFIGEANKETRMLVTVRDKEIRTSSTFQMLKSYFPGLRLSVQNFEFEKNPFGIGNDFVGIDTIMNNSSVTVKQTIEHHKRVFESVEITTDYSWGHSFEIEFNVGLKVEIESSLLNKTLEVPPINFKLETSYPEDAKKTSYFESIRDISTRREIIVHPFTSIQACSTVGQSRNFSTPYSANVIYTGPGLTASEVQSILSKDNIIGIEVDNGIRVEISGTFSGTLMSTTKFIVSENGGCVKLGSKINKLNVAHRNNLLTPEELLAQEIEINDFILRHNQ